MRLKTRYVCVFRIQYVCHDVCIMMVQRVNVYVLCDLGISLAAGHSIA